MRDGKKDKASDGDKMHPKDGKKGDGKEERTLLGEKTRVKWPLQRRTTADKHSKDGKKTDSHVGCASSE